MSKKFKEKEGFNCCTTESKLKEEMWKWVVYIAYKVLI